MNLLNRPKCRRKLKIFWPQKSMIFEGFKIFNRENRDEKDISSLFKDFCGNCNIEMPKWDKVVGKPIKAADRTIYPIIEVVTVGNNMHNFRGIEIFPIALVIEESGKKYAISLTGEEINSDEFIGMISKEK